MNRALKISWMRGRANGRASDYLGNSISPLSSPASPSSPYREPLDSARQRESRGAAAQQGDDKLLGKT